VKDEIGPNDCLLTSTDINLGLRYRIDRYLLLPMSLLK